MSKTKLGLTHRANVLFQRMNTLLSKFDKHHQSGLLNESNWRTISNSFSDSIGLSPKETLLLVKQLKTTVECYNDSQNDTVWSSVRQSVEVISERLIDIQCFKDSLLFEAESSTDSLLAKLELRKLYGDQTSLLIEDLYQWCLEVNDSDSA